jgi:hypothetical protein
VSDSYVWRRGADEPVRVGAIEVVDSLDDECLADMAAGAQNTFRELRLAAEAEALTLGAAPTEPRYPIERKYRRAE